MGQAWSQVGAQFFSLGQEASSQSCSKANSSPVREAARHGVPIYPVVKCAAPAVCQLHPGPWAWAACGPSWGLSVWVWPRAWHWRDVSWV